MQSQQIDVALLQEWSATIRDSAANYGTESESSVHDIKAVEFPLEFFPGYNPAFDPTQYTTTVYIAPC